MARCGTRASYIDGCRCEACTHAEAEYGRLRRERNDPPESPHRCEDCGRHFRNGGALRTHVGRVHLGAKTKPDRVQRLFLAGIALPMRRRDGEILPCDGLVDIFFPDYKRPSEYRRKTAAAIELCNTCPRREECLDGAMQRREPCGVWGGVDMATLFAAHIRSRAS